MRNSNLSGLTMTDYNMSAGMLEVNSIPLISNEKYLYRTPMDIVNPAMEITIKDSEGDLVAKYFEQHRDYMNIIQELRLELFIRYSRDKAMDQHKFVRQGHDVPNLNDFVLIVDVKKLGYFKYWVMIGFSETSTKALVRTKRDYY